MVCKRFGMVAFIREMACFKLTHDTHSTHTDTNARTHARTQKHLRPEHDVPCREFIEGAVGVDSVEEEGAEGAVVASRQIPAHVSIRQHTSAYVSIRQHTSKRERKARL